MFTHPRNHRLVLVTIMLCALSSDLTAQELLKAGQSQLSIRHTWIGVNRFFDQAGRAEPLGTKLKASSASNERVRAPEFRVSGRLLSPQASYGIFNWWNFQVSVPIIDLEYEVKGTDSKSIDRGGLSGLGDLLFKNRFLMVNTKVVQVGFDLGAKVPAGNLRGQGQIGQYLIDNSSGSKSLVVGQSLTMPLTMEAYAGLRAEQSIPLESHEFSKRPNTERKQGISYNLTPQAGFSIERDFSFSTAYSFAEKKPDILKDKNSKNKVGELDASSSQSLSITIAYSNVSELIQDLNAQPYVVGLNMTKTTVGKNVPLAQTYSVSLGTRF